MDGYDTRLGGSWTIQTGYPLFQTNDVLPDQVVFLAVLTACLNSGEVDLGINFFDSMRLVYAIEPTLEHYVVVIDLLGRAGKVNEAHELIESMPIKPDLTTWAAKSCGD